jgi:hypothetical protein
VDVPGEALAVADHSGARRAAVGGLVVTGLAYVVGWGALLRGVVTASGTAWLGPLALLGGVGALLLNLAGGALAIVALLMGRGKRVPGVPGLPILTLVLAVLGGLGAVAMILLGLLAFAPGPR